MAEQQLPEVKVLEPRVGTPVITRDGDELGRVKEVRDGSFKVDVPRGSDYWLAAVHVSECDDQLTRLSLESAQMEPYKLNEPGQALAGNPALEEMLPGQPGTSRRRRTQQAEEADMVQERARETMESARHMTEEGLEAWDEARREPTPRGITAALENVPSPAYFWGAMATIGLSAMLTLTGKVRWANFVGLWPPTILLLGLMSKMMRPSREM